MLTEIECKRIKAEMAPKGAVRYRSDPKDLRGAAVIWRASLHDKQIFGHIVEANPYTASVAIYVPGQWRATIKTACYAIEDVITGRAVFEGGAPADGVYQLIYTAHEIQRVIDAETAIKEAAGVRDQVATALAEGNERMRTAISGVEAKLEAFDAKLERRENAMDDSSKDLAKMVDEFNLRVQETPAGAEWNKLRSQLNMAQQKIAMLTKAINDMRKAKGDEALNEAV